MVTPSHQDGSWLLSAVYASPRFAESRLLWENLSSVVGLHSLSWVVIGDFNEVLIWGKINMGVSQSILAVLFSFKNV